VLSKASQRVKKRGFARIGIANKCEGPHGASAEQEKLGFDLSSAEGDEADGGSIPAPERKAGLSYLDDDRGPGAQNAQVFAGQKAQFAQAGGQARRSQNFGDNGFGVPRQLRQVERGV